LTGLISNNVECSGREAAQENYSCDTAFSIEFRDHSDYSRGRGGGGGGGGVGGGEGGHESCNIHMTEYCRAGVPVLFNSHIPMSLRNVYSGTSVVKHS